MCSKKIIKKLTFLVSIARVKKKIYDCSMSDFRKTAYEKNSAQNVSHNDKANFSSSEKTGQSETLIKTTREKESVYRRVAKFLLIIGVDDAAKVMKHLTEEQTEKIIPELASIRSVPKDEGEAILAEFKSLIEKAKTSGGLDTAKEMLQKAYGDEKANALIEKAKVKEFTNPFEFLRDASDEQIVAILKDESDGVQALVLSRLTPKKAANFINALSTEKKKCVVSRLAKLESISPEVMMRLDKALHEKFLSLSIEKTESIDGKAALAEILRRLPQEKENALLSLVSKKDADDLRSRLFTLSDIENMDEKFLQRKLRVMSEKDIAFLIAGKEEKFRETILQNMSKGKQQNVLEEESLSKPMRKSDCEKITNEFLNDIRRDWEAGEFLISGRDEEAAPDFRF